MVRLRRELEGIRRRFEVPVPSYAQDPRASAALLPSLDEWLLAREPGRILLAGVPRPELARQLARTGHWVTLCDLEADDIARIHPTLQPAEADRLTLVDKPYGEASFSASSFDVVVLSDAVHRYAEPRWVFQKAARECKPDALLAARLLVQGRLDTLAQTEPPAQRGHAWAERLGQQTLAQVTHLLHTPLASALAGEAATEAIDRGAHLRTATFAIDAADTLAQLAQCLRIEQVWVGHSLRLALADLAYGLRSPAHAAVLRSLGLVPEMATASDRRSLSPRVLAVVARRALR